MRRFADRAGAGRELAERLNAYRGRPQAIVLGLARGGVPVAFEVARTLELALDVFVVRKLGVPDQQELAIGASGGVRVLNRQVIDALGLSTAQIEAVAEREQIELDRRERAYRGRRAPATVAGATRPARRRRPRHRRLDARRSPRPQIARGRRDRRRRADRAAREP